MEHYQLSGTANEQARASELVAGAMPLARDDRARPVAMGPAAETACHGMEQRWAADEPPER